ncbi:MCE family protein [Carbonactinospora thermoautotrophica]|uniref:Mammalian cell entry protein n=1 Tax=Carbonactinospora thermoautotrophica TaxID=1469144 RepID=A0A132N0T7_9ACTN|nr:MCE family protein [Carbonactinospora thermoautotrophica]KWX02721.1 Virulence factor Mce family protein [Carbonactinospora thermoautotrophica]KWX03768.1 mammalian cell entry protein [Carbonactinospora thermoautotrophica]KWX06667.1 mammalian cell entry protein [Carbonactinospora thermoautotrophica]MCX9190548.1 MCE family protein [Carbonactinospora thermoautotrophica]
MRRVVRALAGAIAGTLLLTACQFNGLYDMPLPGGAAQGDDVYRVTVEFDDVLDLVPRSSVRVDDVTVGTVEKIWLDGWHAKVRLRIKNSVELPDNAVASIRQTSLLGEKFVSLAPPTDQQPVGRLGDGDVIPLSRSSRSIEVEEVLSALSLLLNGGGVAQLRTISHELNEVMAGREDRIKDLLEQLDTLVKSLDQRKAEIVRAIENLDKLSRTLAAQRQTIGVALDQIHPGLKALADQRAQLVQMLQALSELGVVGTRVINASQQDLIANLKALEPILTRLNQAGNDLPKALELLVTFPFPKNAADAVRGSDYTNLRIKADLDLKTLYDNLIERDAGEPRQDCPPLLGCPEVTLPPLVPVPGPIPCPTKPLPGVPLSAHCPTPAPTGKSGGSGSGSRGALCPPICIGGAAYEQGGSGYGAQYYAAYYHGFDPRLVTLLLGPMGGIA